MATVINHHPGHPFASKQTLTIPAEPVCMEFVYDGGTSRHKITMAVPRGMAEKACAVRGFKVGNTFNVQGKPYLILTVSTTEKYVDGISTSAVEMEMMALSSLVPAVLGTAATPAEPNTTVAVKMHGVTHIPDKPKTAVKSLVHLFQKPARKIIQ